MAVLSGSQAKALKALLQDQNLGEREKLSKLREMYVKVAGELNKLQSSSALLEKKLQQTEEDARLAAKKQDKMQQLCRELQKNNKTILEENVNRVNEEATLREKQQEKFQASIENITKQLESYEKDRVAKAEENKMLHETLQDYISKYDAFKDLIEKQSEAKDQESKLQQKQAKEAIELMKDQIKNLTLDEEKVTLLTKENLVLKKQLKASHEQLQDFQKSASQTSEVVSSVKAEIKKMNKRSAVVEGENSKLVAQFGKLKAKYESDLSEKTAIVRKQRGQIDNLKALCRKFQNIMNEQEETIKTIKGEEAEVNKQNNQKAEESDDC